MEMFASNASEIDTMFNDGASECKKWRKNESEKRKVEKVV
jgi:hypothetical protein